MCKFNKKQMPSSFFSNQHFKKTNKVYSKQTRSSTTQNNFIPQYKTTKLQRLIKYQNYGTQLAKNLNPSSIKLFKNNLNYFC